VMTGITMILGVKTLVKAFEKDGDALEDLLQNQPYVCQFVETGKQF